jgi:hypothetical protein
LFPASMDIECRADYSADESCREGYIGEIQGGVTLCWRGSITHAGYVQDYVIVIPVTGYGRVFPGTKDIFKSYRVRSILPLSYPRMVKPVPAGLVGIIGNRAALRGAFAVQDNRFVGLTMEERFVGSFRNCGDISLGKAKADMCRCFNAKFIVVPGSFRNIGDHKISGIREPDGSGR